MSKALLDALEHRVTSAVDTIEGLRAEVSELREERRILEDKLRELLSRIEAIDSGNGTGTQRMEAGKGAAAYGHSTHPNDY